MRERLQIFIAAFIALFVIMMFWKKTENLDYEPALIIRARALNALSERMKTEGEAEDDSTDFFARIYSEGMADWGELIEGDSLLNRKRWREIVLEVLDVWARY